MVGSLWNYYLLLSSGTVDFFIHGGENGGEGKENILNKCTMYLFGSLEYLFQGEICLGFHSKLILDGFDMTLTPVLKSRLKDLNS